MPDDSSKESPMRVLVLGSSGMLGSTLLRTLVASPGVDVWGTLRSTSELPPEMLAALSGRIQRLEVLDDGQRRELLSSVRPDMVVNAVGVVKQAPGLSDDVATVRVNALFPHLLADDCTQVGSRLIHVSTDCVFSGRRGGYTEDDVPDPVDFYGRSKLLGEVGEPHLTIRTSIIGPELTRHRSLLDWFLKQHGSTVQGFSRAIYSGVTTVEFSRFLASVVIPQRQLTGLYHLASEPISKYELLNLVADAYAWKGRLKANVSFCCDRSMTAERLRRATGYSPPTWPVMIRELHEAHVSWGYQASKGSDS